jgi:hypothetical protein
VRTAQVDIYLPPQWALCRWIDQFVYMFYRYMYCTYVHIIQQLSRLAKRHIPPSHSHLRSGFTWVWVTIKIWRPHRRLLSGYVMIRIVYSWQCRHRRYVLLHLNLRNRANSLISVIVAIVCKDEMDADECARGLLSLSLWQRAGRERERICVRSPPCQLDSVSLAQRI